MFLPGVVLAQGWTQTHAPTGNWQALAMSADGSKLVAAVYGGGIYTSTNFGGTWVSNSAPVTNWSGVASSADWGRVGGRLLWRHLHFPGRWRDLEPEQGPPLLLGDEGAVQG